MVSFDRRRTCWHKFRVCVYISLTHLVICQHGQGYLTEKPHDAVRAVGQSVTFTCNSSWIVPIRWWFLCSDCAAADDTVEELGTDDQVRLTLRGARVTGELGDGSPDGYRSALTIDDVTKWHAGTFRCQDGTGSQASARLTVTSTPEVFCLPVSPRDEVVVKGDSVVLSASNPSSRLRHYFENSTDSKSGDRVELYDGEELNDCAVDERFSVVGVGDQGHADLVIRSVQRKDAGRYIVKDVRRKSYEVAVNLVVFDSYPECKQIWHLSDSEVFLQCHAVYTGRLTPRISFLRRDVTEQCLKTNKTGGTIHCSLEIKLSELNEDDIAGQKDFEIGFELSRCGEPAGTWTWKHEFIGDIDLPTATTSSRQFKRLVRPPHAAVLHLIFVVSVVANAVSVVVVVVVLCRQRRQRRQNTDVERKGKTITPGFEYDRLGSNSSISTSSESAKQCLTHCPDQECAEKSRC